MKILIVAFEFPPLNTGGSRRPAWLARELSNSGHHITVWCANYTGTRYASLIDKESSSFDSGVLVERIPLIEGNTPLSFAEPDDAWSLIHKGLRTQWEKLRHSGELPDVVLLTLPPFSLFRFGKWVRGESGIPLVLEMRDHWSLWGMTPFATPLHYLAARYREQRALRLANAILVVTSGMREDLSRTHRSLAMSSIHVCSNAASHFPIQPIKVEPGKDRFSIGHFGAFYYFPEVLSSFKRPWYLRRPRHWALYTPRIEDWKYRSPWYFLRVIRELITMRPNIAERIELRFAGVKPDWFDDMVHEWGLEKMVIHLGHLSAAEAKKRQGECDLLLATSAKIPGGRDYCIPVKTLDYLNSGRPVLGCLPPGDQRDFLLRSGLGVNLNPDDPVTSAQTLSQIMTEGMLFNPDADFLSAYTHEAGAKQVEEVIQRVANEHSDPGSRLH